MKERGKIFVSAFLFIAAVSYYFRVSPQPTLVGNSVGERENKTGPVSEIAIPAPRRQTPVTSVPDALARAFESELITVGRGLPRSENLNRLRDSELHHTPRAITDAAMKVGTIAQRVNSDTRLVPQAIRFYVDCASRTEVEIAR